MLRLEPLKLDECDWEALNRMPDRVIFQTREWLAFLTATQGGRPIVAVIKDGIQTVGYFTGLIVRRMGVKILGSPFPGWTTPYMGFNMVEGDPSPQALEATCSFAFEALGCWHFELRARSFSPELVAGLSFDHSQNHTFEMDLSQSEDDLWKGMTSACRRCIRKAEKVGVTIEEADAPGFAEEYYAQLEDVFAKQELRPTYGVERVRQLIRHVHPTGRLLLLRARSPDGSVIATGIFPAMNGIMYFWGGASWRQHQIMRPNEALFWHAMRHWKKLGMTSFDLGGGGDYKRKYGPREVIVTELLRSRYPGLSLMRHTAKAMSQAHPLVKLRSLGAPRAR